MSRPVRIWVIAAVLLFSSSVLAQDYITIRVLQSERVPYEVTAGDRGIITSCFIEPASNTAATAPVSGNNPSADPNTQPPPALAMNCKSPLTPPAQTHQILNTMLVMASNGNAYIIGCENTWRWSKCGSLKPGNIYRAKLTAKRMSVVYMDDGMMKERPFHILLERVAQ